MHAAGCQCQEEVGFAVVEHFSGALVALLPDQEAPGLPSQCHVPNVTTLRLADGKVLLLRTMVACRSVRTGRAVGGWCFALLETGPLKYSALMAHERRMAAQSCLALPVPAEWADLLSILVLKTQRWVHDFGHLPYSCGCYIKKTTISPD
jgi:hypothetical protein